VRSDRWIVRAALASLAFAAASCATLPAPGPAAPVPAPAPPAAPAPAPAPPRPGALALDGEPLIEVGLAWDLDSLTLAATESASLTMRIDRADTPDLAHGPSRAVRVRAAGDGAATVGHDGGSFALGPGDTLWVSTAGRDARFGWNGRTWRGRGKVFVGPRGGLTLAASVPLEAYLLGVVPGEIGALGEGLLEAGRAQAIAARAYTLFYRGRRGAEGFDLYGTVEDQVYGSIESERPLATRCVEGTRGLVALSEGQPIRANYCSTCGGVTAEVWEAWPAGALPYLVSHADRGSQDHCAASPQYRWREEWGAGEFVLGIERWAPTQQLALPPGGLGDLVDVRVESRSRSGRVWRLVVSATRGEIVIPAHVLRLVVRRPGSGNAILRSNLFKIDVRRDPATRRALAVVASGAGFGHGVGLCQTGALGMARAGSGAESILRHYYRGIELRRLY
jgi:stage II sporulation protein D